MKRDPFQAIADPTRRAILVLLASGAMTPNALAEHFDCSRQAVSKHLHVLAESGLVRPLPEGREIHYTLQPKKIKEIDRWLEQFRAMWEQRFDQLDEVLNTLKRKRP